MLIGCPHFLLAHAFNSLSLFTGHREREREGERERDKERERENEGEIK
jgi:hypothetical protein